MTRPSSKFAREGTAAHHVAELTLKGDIFLPDKVTVEGDEYVVSPGMCRALNPYITYVQGLMKMPGAKTFLEHRLQVPDTNGMVWGTLDCGVLSDWNGLFVADLKFGKGHRVDPDTPQLKLYALGLAALVGLEDASAPVTLTISQPRIPNIDPLRSHLMQLGELWQWQDFEVTPALNKIAAGSTEEKAGSHCRWCVRQTQCKAFAGLHQSRASNVFEDIP